MLLKNGPVARNTCVVLGVLVASLAAGRPLAAQELGEEAIRQIQAIYADKATWTPAERKLATPLLMAHRQSRGEPMIRGLSPFPRVAARAGVDAQGMVIVDIKAAVTGDLLSVIADVGGALISSYPTYDAVRARVPIRRIDAIAALPEVRQMGPKEPFLVNTGSVTTEGDVAHAADAARTMYSIDGSGVRIGVLSNGVDSLAARQGTLDLPPTCADPPAPGPCVAVMPGQDGSGDEGTAMLEIVHDLAPGAQLFFATAINGSASFATNIQTLRDTYGCDVIVDDITYIAEGAFQDDSIAQAVNAVTKSGALYFSSAGNSGRLSAGTSGTWEGDYFETCWCGSPSVPCDYPIHGFDGQQCPGEMPSDPLTDTAPSFISLKWSDPLGGSANDYDLFLLDSTLSNILDASAFSQTGTQDPLEVMFNRFPEGNPGEKIVVAKYSGAARALRLDTHRGELSIATDGSVFGHNGGESTISVAAVNVGTAGGGTFTGGAANPVETYSSDGPRHMFYNPNGTAITPGNLLFGSNGGRELPKPDVTAADCVATATPPPFNPFCGTSAAAPHAAAVAGLLLSTDNNPSGGQALAAMFTTALDVNPAGRDIDSGAGIVMADDAATALASIPANDFYTLDPCRVLNTTEASGPTSGAPLMCGSDYEFTMTGGTCGVPASATAISVNVTVTQATNQGNVRLFASGAPAPSASTLNYVAGVNRANNAVTPISAAGKVAVRCAPTGTTHVIIDVNGYFE